MSKWLDVLAKLAALLELVKALVAHFEEKGDEMPAALKSLSSLGKEVQSELHAAVSSEPEPSGFRYSPPDR